MTDFSSTFSLPALSSCQTIPSSFAAVARDYLSSRYPASSSMTRFHAAPSSRAGLSSLASPKWGTGSRSRSGVSTPYASSRAASDQSRDPGRRQAPLHLRPPQSESISSAPDNTSTLRQSPSSSSPSLLSQLPALYRSLPSEHRPRLLAAATEEAGRSHDRHTAWLESALNSESNATRQRFKPIANDLVGLINTYHGRAFHKIQDYETNVEDVEGDLDDLRVALMDGYGVSIPG